MNSYAAEFGGTGGVEKLEPELAPNAPGRAGIRDSYRRRIVVVEVGLGRLGRRV